MRFNSLPAKKGLRRPYLFIVVQNILCNLAIFIHSLSIHRETDLKGQTTFSKCQMYDVNWTTIQSWDYENWNSTGHHEKLNASGKYWQVTKLNKRKINE